MDVFFKNSLINDLFLEKLWKFLNTVIWVCTDWDLTESLSPYRHFLNPNHQFWLAISRSRTNHNRWQQIHPLQSPDTLLSGKISTHWAWMSLPPLELLCGPHWQLFSPLSLPRIVRLRLTFNTPRVQRPNIFTFFSAVATTSKTWNFFFQLHPISFPWTLMFFRFTTSGDPELFIRNLFSVIFSLTVPHMVTSYHSESPWWTSSSHSNKDQFQIPSLWRVISPREVDDG